MNVDLTHRGQQHHGAESRRAKFAMRYEMYHDNYRHQSLRRLKDIYSKAEILNMDKQIDNTNNVYKTIVNKISRVYTFGIKRNIGDPKMEVLYTKSRIDKYMKQANRYVNAFNDVLLQVGWNDKKNRPVLNFRYPHKTRVRVDDFGDPEEVEYFVSFTKVSNGYTKSQKNAEKWAFWSETEHYYKIYKADGNYDKELIQGNEAGTNPYGALPFVFVQNGFRDTGFFDKHSGTDLTDVTLDMAVYNTFKNYMIKWQSFKQVVIQGSNISKLNGQIMDPATALSADGQDVKIDVLDLQANLQELSDTIEVQSTNVAVNYNISPSQFRMTGSVSSGFALKMENTNLDEYTEEQQVDFVRYEEDLHRLLVIIGNTNSAGFADDPDFSVSFNPIEYAEAEGDTLEAQEKAIALGLTNPVEIIENEQGVPTEDAEKIYATNIKYRNQANENLNTPTLSEAGTAEALGLTGQPTVTTPPEA